MAYEQTLRMWMDAVAQDLRYGLRALRRTPLAAAVMIASVALGIGVTTAVFTIADAMLLRPLPFPLANRLVVPFQTVTVASRSSQDTLAWSFARYELLRRAVPGFARTGFATWADAVVRAGEADRPVRIEALTRSLYGTFLMAPQAGRPFSGEEDDGVSNTSAMISDRLWRTAFGASYSILGATIYINSVPVTVVGVMPPRFTGFTIGADVWMPIRMMARVDPSERWRDKLAYQSGTVVARMQPMMTLPALQRHLDAALPIINQVATARFIAPDAQLGIGVMTLAQARQHPLVKPILAVMAAAVASVLLIVCANVASILLARGHARRGEIGVRIAVGASQARVGRQVLTESLLLAGLALPPGVWLGYLCADSLAQLRPALPQNWVLLRGTDLLAGASLAPNLHVLLFASLVAAAAALFFGIGPAVAASRVDAAKLITSAGEMNSAPPVRGRQTLVVAQVGLATALLVSAGLMIRSLTAMLDTDLGFQPDGVVALRLTSTDTSAAARLRRQEFIEHTAGMAGVGAVATAGCVPFDLSCLYTTGVRAIGVADASARAIESELHAVSAGYFRVLRIQLLSGRVFTAEDSIDGRRRAVISATTARRLFGTTDAAGRLIAFEGSDGEAIEVIGVARDVRFKSVETAVSPAVYLLAGEDTHAPRYAAALFVRSSFPTDVAISVLSREIRVANAPLSLSEARSLHDLVRSATASTRFVALLLLVFAVTAAALAGLGIYGVIAYIVSQRTREFGVRLVLGAEDRHLLRMMVNRGAGLVATGLATGVIGGAGASRLVSSFLFGIGTFDGITYLAVIASIGMIGLLATWLPARRILRIDPAVALRSR